MKLYPHQLNALEAMSNGCILNGGTGTGKSLTAIAYYYLQNGGARSTLTSGNYVPFKKQPLDLYIITTARKRDMHDWDKELSNFMMSTHPEGNLYSNKIIADSWNNIERYISVSNAFFIFDEQRVVGGGRWAKSFIKIAKKNKWILLSATPGDKWEDYRSVFIANGFYKGVTDFNTQHINFDYRAGWPRVVSYCNVGRLVRLRNRILVDMEFNRKTFQHHKLIRTEFDRDIYNIAFKKRKNPEIHGWIPSQPDMPDAKQIGVDISLKDVTPIMDGWDYVPKQGDWVRYEYAPIESASEYCYILRKIVNSDKSKQAALIKLVQEHDRSIIFYKYDYELEILHSLFDNQQVYAVAEWNGHKHNGLPDTKKWVYFVQYTAGCEGWNCIETDTIIFFSPDYSYKVMIQACGRIDRLNTPYQDLYYYHLISKSSIDNAIIRSLKGKKRFNEGRFFNA